MNGVPVIHFRRTDIFHIATRSMHTVAIVESNTCWQTLLKVTKLLHCNHVFCCITALIRIKPDIRSYVKAVAITNNSICKI